jgi:hypothetical protein
MNLQFPEFNELITEIKELKSLFLQSQKDDFLSGYTPRTRMREKWDLSNSSCVNYEKNGLLKPFKFGHKIFYKNNEIIEVIKEKKAS